MVLWIPGLSLWGLCPCAAGGLWTSESWAHSTGGQVAHSNIPKASQPVMASKQPWANPELATEPFPQGLDVSWQILVAQCVPGPEAYEL